MKLKDIANQLGLSVSTVSRAINHTGRVSEETRRQVLKLTKELNYQPDDLARGLKMNTTKTLGVIVPDISNIFYAEILSGISNVASQEGYSVMICNSGGEVEEENKQVGLLIKKRVAGIVVAASGNEAPYYEKCQLSKIPVAFVDNMITSPRRYLGISVDNALIAYNLTRHLLKLGHRRIATITGRLEDNTAAQRLSGYRRAMEEIGVAVEERLIVHGEFGSKSSGYEAAKLLFALPAEQRPTAILAQNNHIAFGAYGYLREQKLKAPRDISIACFDAIDLSGLMKPRLTCYIQPARQFGEIAAQKLFDEIEGRISSAASVGRILLDASFVKGGSCAELGAE